MQQEDEYVNTQELNSILREEIAALLTEKTRDDVADFDVPVEKKPYVIMVVGVNGVGKTTTIGKSAYQLRKPVNLYIWEPPTLSVQQQWSNW